MTLWQVVKLPHFQLIINKQSLNTMKRFLKLLAVLFIIGLMYEPVVCTAIGAIMNRDLSLGVLSILCFIAVTVLFNEILNWIRKH